MWGELTRRFADDVILPFNHTMFAEAIIRLYLKDVEKAINGEIRLKRNDMGTAVKDQLKYLKLKAHVGGIEHNDFKK